jgi:hypothetical protein
MAFTGEFSECDRCLLCNEPRRDTQGRPRKVSYHYEIIPRLQGMFQDPEQSRALNRDNAPHNDNPDLLADKFVEEKTKSFRMPGQSPAEPTNPK